MTSGRSQPTGSMQMELPELMSSAEGSPAKTYHEQTVFGAAAQDFKARARAFGASTPELLAKYDPDSSSWKTCPIWLATELTSFSGTWPRAGMMRNGIAYQRPSLADAAPVKGSGWFRTPVASDWLGSTGKGSRRGTLAEFLMLFPGPHHKPLRGKTGFPNPLFLEWLMGLPTGWTELGELEQLETPSSRKSPR
jgi:hypothetical protein